MIVNNNQQQLTGHCSFQEYSVLLQSPLHNNGNQVQHAIITIISLGPGPTIIKLENILKDFIHNIFSYIKEYKQVKNTCKGSL